MSIYDSFDQYFQEVKEKYKLHLSYIDQLRENGIIVILCSKNERYLDSRYFFSIGLDFRLNKVSGYVHKNESIDPEMVNDLKVVSEQYLKSLSLTSVFSA